MSKGIITITQEVDTMICQYCNQEHIVIIIFRNNECKQDNSWLIVHGYCPNCGKPVNKHSEQLHKINRRNDGMDE